MQLNITSEIGLLEAVMLHRPGIELERLTNDNQSELLFDDIPWLKRARDEHDTLVNVFRDHNIRVFFLEDLLMEILKDRGIKEALIKDIVNLEVENVRLQPYIIDYLCELPLKKLKNILFAGITKGELGDLKLISLADRLKDDNSFYISPLPNLYFSRDQAAIINNGIVFSNMKNKARIRESLYIRYLYFNHPLFKNSNLKIWYGDKYELDSTYSIEGGDILVLREDVVAIGYSQRTSLVGIELLAETLLKESQIEKVLVIRIPPRRAYMHLDTVFTMVERDAFLYFPNILNELKVFTLYLDKSGKLSVKEEGDLKKGLEDVLNLKNVRLIATGGGDLTLAAREQWHDATNAFMIAPGKAITYARNEITNEELQKEGIEVISIHGDELGRGRGGIRCMTMPLKRSSVDS